MTCLKQVFILVLSVLPWHVLLASDGDNSTVHVFLLMVPESKLEGLRRRVGRQEEAAGGALEGLVGALGPAANVAQILQGILGADLNPIFAGSIAFIPEGDFRDGVTQVLQQTLAPAIKEIFMEFNKNVQMALNSTSPRPNRQNNTNTNQFQQQQFPQQNNFNQFQQQNPQLNNFNQFQQSQGQFQPNYNNQFQQQGYPSNNHPNQFQQQPGNFHPTQQQNQFQQQPPNFNPNHQNQYFQPNNFQQTPQNQIQSPPNFQPQQLGSNLNQFPSQNFQPNYNQFQQNIHPQQQQQPNFNQFPSNVNNPTVNNHPNLNTQFQQQTGQLQANLNQFQQQQSIAGIAQQGNVNHQLNQPQSIASQAGSSLNSQFSEVASNFAPSINPVNTNQLGPNPSVSKKLKHDHRRI